MTDNTEAIAVAPITGRFQSIYRRSACHVLVSLLGLVSLMARVLAVDWPMLGRDATRNPVSPESNPPVDWDLDSGKNLRWRAHLGSVTFSDPVVASGLVWIGSNNWRPWRRPATNEAATLLGFRASDGRGLVDYEMPPLKGPLYRLAVVGLNGSPMIEGDRMWFVTARAEVVAWDLGPLHRETGAPAELWKRDLIGEFGVYPRMTFMSDGKLCSIPASFRNRLYVVTANGASPHTWPPVVPAPQAPSLICFEKDTGQVVWTDNSPGTNVIAGQWGSPLVAEIGGRGQVITPQGDGWVRSFDADTGALLWKLDINPKTLPRPMDRNHFLNTPVLYEGRVYVAGGQDMEMGEGPGRLWCLDPTRHGDISPELRSDDGTIVSNPNSGVLWHYEGLGRSRSNVAVKDGLLIAAGLDGVVHCLDAMTGQPWWRYSTRAWVYASPLVVDGTVYVGNEDGDVHVLALARDLRVIARHQLHGPIYSSPVYANGVLYLATNEHLNAIASEEDATPGSVADWPQWRGPERANASRDTGLLRAWPTNGPPLRWIATGLGEGIAAVAVAAGSVYTLGYRDQAEYLYALEASEGEPRWVTTVGTLADRKAVGMHSVMRWLSPRVPTVDKDRIYTISAAGTLTCLGTAAGEIRWQKSYPQEFLSPSRIWGFCDYPLVDGDRLVCTPAGPGGFFAALDKRTGVVLWKTPGLPGEGAGYGAMVVSEAAGRRHYVALLARSLIGIAPEDGRILWHQPRSELRVASYFTPIVRDDWVLSPNGYGAGLKAYRILREGDGLRCVEQYHETLRIGGFEDSTVLVGDHLFVTEQAGVEVCLDWRTGQRLWTSESPDRRRRAALTYADRHLYVRRSDGSVTLVEATADGYREKGRFSIPQVEEATGVTFPVVAGGHLYLRDNNRLFCHDIRDAASPSSERQVRRIALQRPPLRPGENAGAPNPPRVGVDRSPDAIFVPTPNDVVRRMLAMAELRPGEVLYDLGSGDGRILIEAARSYGSRAVGLEIDPRLVASSREAASAAGLGDLVRIDHADIFEADLSGADVIAAYLPEPLLERLVPKFQALKPGVRIVTHQFRIPEAKTTNTVSFVSEDDGDRHAIHLWRVPLEFSGPRPAGGTTAPNPIRQP